MGKMPNGQLALWATHLMKASLYGQLAPWTSRLWKNRPPKEILPHQKLAICKQSLLTLKPELTERKLTLIAVNYGN